MFSWEIKKLLEERGYYIGDEELLKLISIEENPQLNHIIYNAFTNKYQMWDNEGNQFEFTPKPKQLVKKSK